MEKCIKTPCGMTIYAYRNPALHGFYLSLYVRAGSIYENEDNSGITHFLEHVLIRNINMMSNGALYALLDRYGMEFNASTYAEMIQFYISGAAEHFVDGIEMITKIFSPITLLAKEIDLERRRIKAEIREGDDGNSLANFTGKILYPDSTARLPILGTNRSISKITKTMLEEYRREIFTPENMFFYVTGCFSEEALSTLADAVDRYSFCQSKKRENIAPVPRDFLCRNGGVFIKKADYTMLRFNFDLDMTRMTVAESDLLYDILFSGYNSRFFMEMSERRGLFYDISGALDRYTNIGNIYFTFEVRQTKVYEAVRIAVELLREIKKTLLREDEILRASYVDNAFLLYDDPRELNFTFAYDAHIMNSPYRSLKDRREAYQQVTPSRLRVLANEIFTSRGCTLTMKGDKKNIDADVLHNLLLELDK